MKNWLTYICLFAGCILTLPSCTPESTFEATFNVPSDETSIELTLSYSGDGPMSRDVDSPDADLDYTTPAQCALDLNDIFVLAFEQTSNGTLNLLNIVKDLQLIKGDESANTWTIKGTIPQQGMNKTIRFVVLTNLTQNGIVINRTPLNSKAAVETALKDMIGDTDTEIYERLIYNYDASDGKKWVIEDRRIPMWGISEEKTLNQSEITMNNPIYLYRAVAKVQIWVNNKNGIAGQDGKPGTQDDFIITSIVVNNANAQGYCVSEAPLVDDIYTQYETATVPDGVDKQTESITYTPSTDDEKQKAYSDLIYLPEQINTDADAVTITINYTYNKNPFQGTIEFRENGVGDRFNVVRNHSYIFNIASVNTAEDVKFNFKYEVIDWTSITNPPLNFGNGDGDVTK